MTPGPWRKSSRSGNSGGNCVEARMHGAVPEIRDSKYPASGILTGSPSDFVALLRSIRQPS